MSQDLLAHLRQWNAFDPHPLPEVLGELHVPFDELLGGRTVEARLEEALGRGGRVAIIGSSGSGKSSVLAHVLQCGPDRLAPIPVPLAVSIEHKLDAPAVADRLIFEVAAAAHDLQVVSEREREATQIHRAVERPVAVGRNITASAKLPWLDVGLAADLQHQTQAAVDVLPEEKLEVVYQILTRVADHGLHPVLIFDDTDRWIPGAGYEHPERTVEAFFGRVVRWISDLGFAVVVAVHDRYFTDVRPRADLLGALDTPIDLPRLPDESALVRVLQRRLANACEDSEHEDSHLEDAFEPGAVQGLYAWYVRHEDAIRGVVRTAHTAMIEAADAGLPRVTAAGVNAALASDG